MSKVLEFKQNATALVSAGRAFFERDRFGDAIDCFYRAHLKDTDSSGIMCDLGEAYLAISDPMQAAYWYLRALHVDETSENVYSGLVRSYSDMGYDMREAAYYYFTLSRDHGIITPEQIECLGGMEEDDEVAENTYGKKTEENLNDTMKYQRAQSFMRDNALPAAYILFASVSKNDSHYSDARRMMMKIDYERGRYGDATELADELLQADSCDTQALIFGAAAYDKLGVKDKRDNYFERAEPGKESSADDLETLARVAWYMGRYEDALGLLLKVKNFLPYDREIILQIALCYANMGEKQAAKQYIIDVCRLYPDDLALRYYAEEIDALEGKAQFEPIDTVPEPEAVRREDALDDFMVEHNTITAATLALKKDERMREYLDWLYQEGDRGLQISVGSFLSQSRKWRGFFEQQLISPYISEEVKKKILVEILEDMRGDISVTTAHLYRRVTYNPPEELIPCVEDVYRYTFVSLLFFGDGYGDDLDDVYLKSNRKLADMFISDYGKIDIPALAAAVCYRSNLTREKLGKEDCVEVFDCNRKKFEEYIESDILSDMKKLRKATRAKSQRREFR